MFKRLIKFGVKVYQKGDAASAAMETFEDVVTLVGPGSTPLQRVGAALSLASELLPVSVDDAKDAWALAKRLNLDDKAKRILQRADNVPGGSKIDDVGESAAQRCTRGGCGGPGVCFVAGTPVATENGPVAIEQLRLGDRVEAGNPLCADEHISPEARTIRLEIPNPKQPLDISR